MKDMFKRMFIPIMVCLFTAATGYATQGQGWIGTPVEAKKMVEKAIIYLLAHGPDKALEEFNRPNGKFQWRDLYVFACDSAGVVAAHPDAKLIGRNMYEVPDIHGKPFWKDIVDLANSRGSGWVDYQYLDRITGQEAFKITYFQKVGDLIVCCGAYLP